MGNRINSPKYWSYRVNATYSSLYKQLDHLRSEAIKTARKLGKQCPTSFLELVAKIAKELGVDPIKILVSHERITEDPIPEITIIILVDPEEEFKEGLVRIYDRIREELGIKKLPFYIETATPRALIWDDIVVLKEYRLR